VEEVEVAVVLAEQAVTKSTAATISCLEVVGTKPSSPCHMASTTCL